MNRLHARAGAAPSNFPDRLPAADSELAQQLTRDPYVLDFLDLTARRRTRPGNRSGPTGRRPSSSSSATASPSSAGSTTSKSTATTSPSTCCSSTATVPLRRPRTQDRPVRPEHLGQLGFYIARVDDHLRIPDRHSPTVGIPLCAGRNDNVVRYALARRSGATGLSGRACRRWAILISAQHRDVLLVGVFASAERLGTGCRVAVRRLRRLEGCSSTDPPPAPNQVAAQFVFEQVHRGGAPHSAASTLQRQNARAQDPDAATVKNPTALLKTLRVNQLGALYCGAGPACRDQCG